MQLALTPNIENAIIEQATQKGMTPEYLALEILWKSLIQPVKLTDDAYTIQPNERIQTDILNLPYSEFAALRKWLADLEWERWDKQIEEDSVAGKLDFLIEEALLEYEQGQTREL
ncbi:MAG: hypothetical protein AAF639_35650 [Chloroflexota bacterium]